MKRILFLALAVGCLGVSSANAQVGVFFSISDTDAGAGNVLNLNDGDSGSLYVWVDNMDSSGNAVDGIDLDIIGSGDPMVVANGFNIDNPQIGPGINRWDGAGTGTLGSSPGLLVDDANAVTLLPALGGIQNGIGPVLHATLDFTVTGTGTTDLNFDFGQFGISVVGQAPQSVNFGGAQINSAGGAIPEPSAMALVGAIFGGVMLRRRRSV